MESKSKINRLATLSLDLCGKREREKNRNKHRNYYWGRFDRQSGISFTYSTYSSAPDQIWKTYSSTIFYYLSIFFKIGFWINSPRCAERLVPYINSMTLSRLKHSWEWSTGSSDCEQIDYMRYVSYNIQWRWRAYYIAGETPLSCFAITAQHSAKSWRKRWWSARPITIFVSF